MISEHTPLGFSKTFYDDDAEITFRSSDGISFKIHAANLKACTGGFSPPEGSNFHEVVSLSESSSTLDLLFKFIYPVPQPDFQSIKFDVLFALTEAAEKYEIFPAMDICQIYMREAMPRHAGYVLAYALKHDYPEIINEAALHTLDIPLEEMLTIIPTHFIPWVRYRDKWSQVAIHCINHPPSTYDHVNAVRLISCMGIITSRLSALRDPTCLAWFKSLEAKTAKIPSFYEIISGKKSSMSQDSALPTKARSLLEEHNGKGIQSEHSANAAEVIFIASDDKSFRIPEININACSTGFPSPTESASVPIRLSETSATLHLLLQFMCPVRHPDISSVDFDILERLASAAEKYRVYPAMSICRFYMKKTLPLHANAIFSYAGKGEYEDILNIAAPLCITTPLEDVAAVLPARLFAAWVLPTVEQFFYFLTARKMKYYRCWNQVAKNAVGFYKNLEPTLYKTRTNYPTSCNCLPDYEATGIIYKLHDGVTALKDLSSTFHYERSFCSRCRDSYCSWKESVEKDIRAIPEFCTFL